ncbi:hypothetical protein I4F81_002025 [Pyropia yezoensis]|uniref:Uncharacterized protein n=1 Tax=Pyropia yezoensis TaxID=2788 RepID=A0ACC3BN53_PYRYE|nr:hypothetical protein I4F81_002025 [Neopyropia yezoensis]
MARLACVVAAAAVAVATAIPVDGASSLQDGSSRTFFHPRPVWKKPAAVHKPAQGKGLAGHGALPVVILPAESALPVVVLPAESELPVVVLPAESELPVVVLTATPSAAPRTAPPVVVLPSASAAPVLTASPMPTAKPNGRLNCEAATAAPTAAPSAAPSVAPTAAPTVVVVVTAAPMASAAPVSTVVVVAPACKSCDAGRVVAKAVPCVKTQRKLVYGCASARAFFPVTTAAPTATAAALACARWVDVKVQTTCHQRKLVKVCRQVPCPVKAW